MSATTSTRASPLLGSIDMSEIQEVFVPDIGGASDVEVIELLVSVGDEVQAEQSLITVETDKAAMEIPSPVAGRLSELKVAEGDRVSEGTLIALFAVSAGDAPAEENEPDDRQAPAAPPPADEPAEEGDGDDAGGDGGKPAHQTVPVNRPGSSLEDRIPPYSSPSIRRLARELDVHLPDVTGTGARGRITRDDVMQHVREMVRGVRAGDDAAPATGFAGLPPWPRVDFEKYGPVERCELSRIRRIAGANLHRNWVSIPHVTNHEDADITDLEAFRVVLNAENAKAGIKVTLLSLLIKACVAALRKFPTFNASLDGEQLVMKGYYHIGFAADTANGLVVPVVRDADRKGVLEIAEEVGELAAKAREGKLTMEQMSGACFSISSLGGIGGTYFTPIINAPEVAILGVSKARHRMIWNGREAEPRLILPMSLSWDHRVIDGAEAGRFNAYLASVLAEMRRIIL
ncbi:dihydrolipoyllysine-residue acetyltransferase [Alloalcanivorax sp. C16-1]|uniref:dihydrolipoyllysine-residue acetyltransferase n=1 Tax=Alloalcanivorax sp. C16-1 TaxID=3390051 RepID=UPI003970944E